MTSKTIEGLARVLEQADEYAVDTYEKIAGLAITHLNLLILPADALPVDGDEAVGGWTYDAKLSAWARLTDDIHGDEVVWQMESASMHKTAIRPGYSGVIVEEE